MIDPFDAEFLSQELRDSWKKIEELEKENKELKEEIKALEEINDEEFDDSLRKWNMEQYGDY